MSGAIATVTLSSPFTPVESGLVTQLLREYATEVTESRRGRHWEFTDSGSRASLSILRCEHTDAEAIQVENGLEKETATEKVVMIYPLRRDRYACARLSALVARRLNGVDRGVHDD